MYLSFWILSWCRFYRHNQRALPNVANTNLANPTPRWMNALGQQRLGLLMDCTSTRDRLECIGEYFRRYGALAALHPKEFFAVNGVGTVNGQASSGFMEFLKIAGFCIVALIVFTKKDALRFLINDLWAEGQLLAIWNTTRPFFTDKCLMYCVLGGYMLFFFYNWRLGAATNLSGISWVAICMAVLQLCFLG